MNPIRILLVEDDEDDFVLTRGLLEEIGQERFDLEWQASFETGARRVQEGSFDVGLFDFRLGAHTGLELLQITRQRDSPFPVILMTGKGDLAIDLEAMRSGAADYLVKDQIDAALLERSIRYAIQQRRMEEEEIRSAREQEARIQAELAAAAKDEFLATVSHELRNPLNAVLGWITLLNTGGLDAAAQARALKIIERNARAQVQLIDDLLDQARITSGTLHIERQPVELGPILEKLLEAIHPDAEAKSIQLTADLGATPVRVDGDGGRLQQIFANLLSNALKFTPEGGQIAVQLRVEPGQAFLAVRDSGRGIAPEFMHRVFNRFHQANSTERHRKSGLGLGLAIALHLAEAHGGTITAESPGEGLGSTFTVRLPTLP